jgi:hypothetical protein
MDEALRQKQLRDRAVLGLDPEERQRRLEAWRSRALTAVEDLGRRYAGNVLNVLGVRLRAYWEFGAWLHRMEHGARGQRECGNLLRGDGVGGERCGVITSCQAQVADVGAILERVMALMDDNPGADIEVRVKGGEADGRAWLAGAVKKRP